MYNFESIQGRFAVSKFKIYQECLDTFSSIGYELTWSDTPSLISRADVENILDYVQKVHGAIIDLGFYNTSDYDYFKKWADLVGTYSVHNLVDFCSTFPPLLDRFGVNYSPDDSEIVMLDILYKLSERYMEEVKNND